MFDRTNIRSAWTINENAAFTLEFRHRSKYDWRKSDVDIEQSIDQLLHSPLSDGRDTLLSKFQFRFSPLWTCHFESHQGWGRKNEPRYDAYEIKLTTLLTGRWQVEFGYKHSPSMREWIFHSIKLLNAKFYTERDSKFGNLARRLRKFFSWSERPLCEHKARVKDKNLLHS